MKSAAAKDIEPQENAAEMDMDSLHVLPLRIMPLYTSGLKQARLIRNMHFKLVIEVYRDAKAGSGQIKPDALALHFNWQSVEDLEDQRLIEHLARLHSYDVTACASNCAGRGSS